jgi:two-component sensor histidine kinase
LAPAIWLVAVAARWLLDGGAILGPFLTFLPAVALATLYCGRWQAGLVIVLGGAASAWLWLPSLDFSAASSTTALSLALFLLVALFELVLIDALYLASRNNVVQQERMKGLLRLREIMAREMRHRVANQLHLATAMLEGSQGRIDGSGKIGDVIGQVTGRLSAITRLQRIVDEGVSRQRGLAPLLREILEHIFHDVDVAVQVRAAPVELADHHATIICLIVIEAAMNSLKYTFQLRRGCMFAVELRSVGESRLMLKIWDDGPGVAANGAQAGREGLGLAIMRDLAAELGGMASGGDAGTLPTVELSGA